MAAPRMDTNGTASAGVPSETEPVPASKSAATMNAAAVKLRMMPLGTETSKTASKSESGPASKNGTVPTTVPASVPNKSTKFALLTPPKFETSRTAIPASVLSGCTQLPLQVIRPGTNNLAGMISMILETEMTSTRDKHIQLDLRSGPPDPQPGSPAKYLHSPLLKYLSALLLQPDPPTGTTPRSKLHIPNLMDPLPGPTIVEYRPVKHLQPPLDLLSGPIFEAETKLPRIETISAKPQGKPYIQSLMDLRPAPGPIIVIPKAPGTETMADAVLVANKATGPKATRTRCRPSRLDLCLKHHLELRPGPPVLWAYWLTPRIQSPAVGLVEPADRITLPGTSFLCI